MNKFLNVIKKIILIILILFGLLFIIGYLVNPAKKELTVQELAEQIELKVLSNGWSNSAFSMHMSAVQVNYQKIHHEIDFSLNKYHKNLSICQAAIAQNMSPSTALQMNIYKTEELLNCIKYGDDVFFTKFLRGSI